MAINVSLNSFQRCNPPGRIVKNQFTLMEPVFVCWDPDLVPAILSEPAQYPGAKEPLKFSEITDSDRLEYFARYTNASLGRVKNLYLDWARLKGPMSSEC